MINQQALDDQRLFQVDASNGIFADLVAFAEKDSDWASRDDGHVGKTVSGSHELIRKCRSMTYVALRHKR